MTKITEKKGAYKSITFIIDDDERERERERENYEDYKTVNKDRSVSWLKRSSLDSILSTVRSIEPWSHRTFDPSTCLHKSWLQTTV